MVLRRLARAARSAVRTLRRGGATELASTAGQFWDQQIATPSVYWTEHPAVAEYVNTCITGVPWLSATQGLKAGWAHRPLQRGLSIGCGTGNLERDIYFQRICERMDAFDFSKESLRMARDTAKKMGVSGVRYWRGDFNKVVLPRNRYDIVFFHGSLHHVDDPDRLLAEVEKSLLPHGMVYIDEYVGPSRDEWLDTTIAAEWLAEARTLFEAVPEELRRVPVNPPIDIADPSEAIRSSRIVPALEERFDVMHYRPYWGNLLFPLICALRGDRILEAERAPMVHAWIEREQEMVRTGEITKPLFAVMLLRKRATAA